jgi:hypothetical protein
MHSSEARKWRLNGLTGLLAAILLTACGTDTTAPAAGVVRRPLYFDVKGLLNKQIELLSQQRAATVKQVSLRGGTTETARVADVKWANELQIFFQADINKSALRGVYQVDSVTLPGGLVQRHYTRKPGHDIATVAQLSVLSAGPETREISAEITQKNVLFKARKHLQLTLAHGLLTSYAVQGSQKLILFDSLRYATAAQVVPGG